MIRDARHRAQIGGRWYVQNAERLGTISTPYKIDRKTEVELCHAAPGACCDDGDGVCIPHYAERSSYSWTTEVKSPKIAARQL